MSSAKLSASLIRRAKKRRLIREDKTWFRIDNDGNVIYFKRHELFVNIIAASIPRGAPISGIVAEYALPIWEFKPALNYPIKRSRDRVATPYQGQTWLRAPVGVLRSMKINHDERILKEYFSSPTKLVAAEVMGRVTPYWKSRIATVRTVFLPRISIRVILKEKKM